jgi:4-hydroxy-tetrahydrodipicolinate reductase
MSAPPRLAIVGDGRMGAAVASLAAEHGFTVVALLGEADVLPHGITKPLLGGADVAIEFTVPKSAAANIRGCVDAGCPVVCGTTGWEDARASVEEYARSKGGALLWWPTFWISVLLCLSVG